MESIMKIAYVFKTSMASTFQLGSMILPQLENDTHMVDVVGMFFFDEQHILPPERQPGRGATEQNSKRKRNVVDGLRSVCGKA